MTAPFNSNNHIGIELANRLGLKLPRREGHDLAGPCIACKSSDAFRVHQEKAIAQCYSCGEKWSPYELAIVVFGDKEKAKALCVELGLIRTSSRNTSTSDPLATIAEQKGVTPESLKAYGAKATSPQSIQLPAYGPDGRQCTTFSLSVKGDKGLFEKGKKAGLFFPHQEGKVRLPQPGETWYLVEGPKDAAALYGLGLLACGINFSRLAAKFARLFAGVHIILIPDRDHAGEKGSKFSARVLRGVANSVRIAVLPSECKESNGEDVRDVLRRPGGPEQLLQAIADARQPEGWDVNPGDDSAGAGDSKAHAKSRAIPTITVDTDEHRVNDEAIQALAQEPDIYQRGRLLVHLVRQDEDDTEGVIRRRAGTPILREMPTALIRERLTRVAAWTKFVKGEEIPVHPPGWCVNAVHQRGQWQHIRPLEAVLTHPVFLPDGSILVSSGYDSRHKILVELQSNLSIHVAERPTLAEARLALEVLLDVVHDFPFSTPAHQAAWLASLLTPLAWFAFTGPAPWFLFDANIRGLGKGLLADVIALIVLGRLFSVMSYTGEKEELRKRITALAIEGERLVLIDNLAGPVGNDVLDAALTSDHWKDRVLGVSRTYDGPLHVCWYGTGNNVSLGADTARRVCPIRMETADENPELRQGFRYPRLRNHIRLHRAELLSAALTILRAWHVAGRPNAKLPAWGSFDGWSDLIRNVIVWLGLPDPGETRIELQANTDRDAAAMKCFLDALATFDPLQQGKTTAEIIDVVRHPPVPKPEWLAILHDAVLDLAGQLDARRLGYRLRSFRRRNFGDRFLDHAGKDHKAIRWAAFPISEFSKRAETSPSSPPSPPEGEDGGDGEDDSSPMEFQGGENDTELGDWNPNAFN